MKKAQFLSFDAIRFPRSIRLETLTQGEKIEYIYAARKIHSGHEYFLEVDFFSLKDNGIAYRVFMSKNDFVTLKPVPAPKWINSQLDNLLDYFYYSSGKSLVPLNERSAKTIASFLKPKIKDCVLPDEKPLTPLEMILKFQKKVCSKRLEKKHQKDIDRIDGEFANMDKIPKNINDWIEKYPLWYKQYIFYKRKGKKIRGYCSACKSEVYPEYAKHLYRGVCPSCGHPVTFKAEGRAKNTRDTFVFSYIQKGNDGCIIQRVFDGAKSYRNGFDKPSVIFWETRRYTYKDGKYKPYHHGRFKQTDKYRWCDGYPPSHMGSYNFTDRGSLYAKNLREVLQETELRDSRLEKFAETKALFDPMEYVLLFQKQPEIRYLVENGLDTLILEVLNDRSYGSKLEVKSDVFEILKDNKSFFPLFSEIGITSNELRMINSFPSKKFIKKEILLRIRNAGIVKDFVPVLRYTTPIKAINYLAKHVNEKQSYKDALILWLDYLHVAEFLDYEMSSSFIVFPQVLKREHDRINDEYSKASFLTGDEAIASIAGKVNDLFGYENDKFLIRAPKHGKEIKDEGAALRHCVGRYVANMAKLETFILFIREKKNTNKPFFTVEFNKNEIRQCRGYQNGPETPEVKAFLKEWQAQLYKKGRKSLAAAA